MSLFNAFGQGGFAALTQTLENIGNIVAPIAPNEESHQQDDEDDEESESFDSKVQNFFSNMRDQYQQSGNVAVDCDVEPSTPGSFVSIELGANSPKNGGMLKSKETSPRSSDSGSFGYVSGPELEKKVQLKYREQLEDEISSFDRKYSELQSSSARRIQLLEQECAEWKLLAEEFKGQGTTGVDDNSEELNTLYEKLGSMTQELEDKEMELAAAQETILSLNSNMRELDNDSSLQAQLAEVTNELIELRDKQAASDDHIQELMEALERAEQAALMHAQESNAKEDDLTKLTNQLRDSNKTIAALEQKLADIEIVPLSTPVSFTSDVATTLAVNDLQQRLQELQQRQDEVSEHLRIAEDQNAQLRAAFVSLETENSRLDQENISLQNQLNSSSEAATGFAESIHSITSDLHSAKEQLRIAHEEVRVLGEQLVARDTALEEAERVHAFQLVEAQATSTIQPNPALTEEVDRLAAQVQELQVELNRVAAQLKDSNVAHDTLTIEHAALAEELAETVNELSSANESLEDLRLQLAASLESKERVETDKQSLEEELAHLRLHMASASETAAVESNSKEHEEVLRQLQETQNALVDLQQQLSVKDEELAQRTVELTELRAELATVAVKDEQMRTNQSVRIDELNVELSQLSVRITDLTDMRNEALRNQEELQEQVSSLERLLADSSEETSSLHVAMEGLSKQLNAASDERDRALASAQQLERQFAQQTASASVPTLVPPASESPTVLVSKSSSADLDTAGASGASKTTPTTSVEEALAASQAEFAKAIKKIKAVNKLLKERDAEIVKLKDASAAMSNELDALRASQAGGSVIEPAADRSSQDTSGSISDLQEQLAVAESRIVELTTERAEMSSRLDSMHPMTSLQAELAAASMRVTELDEALTSSEESLKAAEELAWQAKAEASELLFAFEQEQARVQQLTATRDTLQEEVSRAREALLQIIDSRVSVHDAEKLAPGQESVLLPTLVESTFAMLRGDSDAAKQDLLDLKAQWGQESHELQQLRSEAQDRDMHIRALEANLAAKEAEHLRLQEMLDTQSGQLEGVESEVYRKLTQKQQELDLFVAEFENERLLVESCRKETHAHIAELESQIAAKSEELVNARSRIAEVYSETQRSAAAFTKTQTELAAALARVTELDEALTSSEESLKAAEELAWQAKAEASELLFAFEQEQARVQQLTATRDSLQDQLGSAQAQLNTTAERETCNRIDRLDEVQEQLFSIYHSLRAASDLLRFVDGGDGAGSIATPGKELTTFEHLVMHCGIDLLSPLSMLALISKTQASLADQIMTHLREQSAHLHALQELEKNASAALQDGSKLVSTLLRVVTSGSTDENGQGQFVDLVAVARKISHDLNIVLSKTEKRLFSQSGDTQRVTNLQEQLTQTQAELSQLKEDALREKLSSTAQLQQNEARIAALQSEVSDHAAQFEDAFRKLSLEKQQVASELHQLQIGSAQYTEQMQTFKLHIQKIETENKQLHQVIAQLRQVRKTTKGESDNAISERDELRAHCNNLQAEVSALQQQVRLFTETEESAAAVRTELNQVTASLATSERNLKSTRRALAQLEKELYDKSAELEVTRTDILLIRQELERRHVEVSNLKEAIQQVESERDFYVSRAQRELVEKLKAAQEQSENERKELEARLSRQLEEERAQRIKLEEARQDHELFHRKAELEFNQEKKKMQRTLENALAQLNNSQQQVIDRMLVANLIVSYFKRRRSVDVLKIIAKVLSFDDEQLIAVGLKVPPIDLLGSLLSTVIGRPAPAPEVKGDNLAEQWINFLIDESDQDAANSAGLVPRARSHSDAHATPATDRKIGAEVDLTYK